VESFGNIAFVVTFDYSAQPHKLEIGMGIGELGDINETVLCLRPMVVLIVCHFPEMVREDNIRNLDVRASAWPLQCTSWEPKSLVIDRYISLILDQFIDARKV